MHVGLIYTCHLTYSAYNCESCSYDNNYSILHALNAFLNVNE